MASGSQVRERQSSLGHSSAVKFTCIHKENFGNLFLTLCFLFDLKCCLISLYKGFVGSSSGFFSIPNNQLPLLVRAILFPSSELFVLPSLEHDFPFYI